MSSLRSSRFLSFYRRRGDRKSGRAKEHAWGEQKGCPPPTAYFLHSRSFPPVREPLEKERKRLLPRLLRGLTILVTSVTHLKAGVNVKAVFTSLNTAFLPISRSRFKRRQIPSLITLSTIWRFCVNFWVIFRCFGKEIFSQRID